MISSMTVSVQNECKIQAVVFVLMKRVFFSLCYPHASSSTEAQALAAQVMRTACLQKHPELKTLFTCVYCFFSRLL